VSVFEESYIRHVCGKRPITTKRDLCLSKETYTSQKRPMCVGIQRELYQTRMRKETYNNRKRPMLSKETYVCWYSKRAISDMYVERDLHQQKETNTYQKRPTHIKRHLSISKETYMYSKRAVCDMYVERDLHI